MPTKMVAMAKFIWATLPCKRQIWPHFCLKLRNVYYFTTLNDTHSGNDSHNLWSTLGTVKAHFDDGKQAGKLEQSQWSTVE